MSLCLFCLQFVIYFLYDVTTAIYSVLVVFVLCLCVFIVFLGWHPTWSDCLCLQLWPETFCLTCLLLNHLCTQCLGANQFYTWDNHSLMASWSFWHQLNCTYSDSTEFQLCQISPKDLMDINTWKTSVGQTAVFVDVSCICSLLNVHISYYFHVIWPSINIMVSVYFLIETDEHWNKSTWLVTLISLM